MTKILTAIVRWQFSLRHQSPLTLGSGGQGLALAGLASGALAALAAPVELESGGVCPVVRRPTVPLSAVFIAEPKAINLWLPSL